MPKGIPNKKKNVKLIKSKKDKILPFWILGNIYDVYIDDDFRKSLTLIAIDKKSNDLVFSYKEERVLVPRNFLKYAVSY